MTNDMNQETFERRNNYSTPKEFAEQLFNQGKFVALVWDWDKYRLGQRIEEMMKLGYSPISGSLVTHTVYNDIDGHKLPVKQDLCLLMTHRGLYEQYAQDVKNKSGE